MPPVSAPDAASPSGAAPLPQAHVGDRPGRIRWVSFHASTCVLLQLSIRHLCSGRPPTALPASSLSAGPIYLPPTLAFSVCQLGQTLVPGWPKSATP
ncbi:hypothetical protein [Azotobacter beijerinckii]|uniref:hypothetical protein n=1 Tax=Azotobacter beijerinckii TaxID=170623 RepID=UPI002955B77E|nr:hypothetical protein [Azotobacter beijerinckii]